MRITVYLCCKKCYITESRSIGVCSQQSDRYLGTYSASRVVHSRVRRQGNAHCQVWEEINCNRNLTRAGHSYKALLFRYFGPVSSNLCKRIRNEDWRAALRGAARAADVEVTERPEARMRSWIEERDWANIR